MSDDATARAETLRKYVAAKMARAGSTDLVLAAIAKVIRAAVQTTEKRDAKLIERIRKAMATERDPDQFERTTKLVRMDAPTCGGRYGLYFTADGIEALEELLKRV